MDGSWLALHPACAAFPGPGPDAVSRIAQQLVGGTLSPEVVVHGDLVVDGRAQLEACVQIGRRPALRRWEGREEDLVPWIIERHLERMALDTSQRALVAAKLATLRRGQRRQGWAQGALTQAQAAALLGISERSVRSAREVLRRGDGALIAQVQQGLLAVSVASRKRTDDPQTVVNEPARAAGGLPRTALRVVRGSGPRASLQGEGAEVRPLPGAGGDGANGTGLPDVAERTPGAVRACVRWLCATLQLPSPLCVVNPAAGDGAWADAFGRLQLDASVDCIDSDAEAAALAQRGTPEGAKRGRGVCADWLTFKPRRFGLREDWALCIGDWPRTVSLEEWVEASLRRAEIVAVCAPEARFAAQVLQRPPMWVARVQGSASKDVLFVWQRACSEQTRFGRMEVQPSVPGGPVPIEASRGGWHDG